MEVGSAAQEEAYSLAQITKPAVNQQAERPEAYKSAAMLLLALDPAAGWQHVGVGRGFGSQNHVRLGAGPGIPPISRHAVARMQFENSLAGKMFGTVAEGLQDLGKMMGIDGEDDAPKAPQEQSAGSNRSAVAVDPTISDLDARAQTGELTFKDFLTMSKTFAKLGNDMPGVMGTMSEKQLEEVREKFAKHEQIVEVMLEDELNDPEILMEDLKAGASVAGPRIQRLAKATSLPETEVALFLMQFEGMRETTRRIAAGEDPAEVEKSMQEKEGTTITLKADANRFGRRADKKNAAKSMKKKEKKKKQKGGMR